MNILDLPNTVLIEICEKLSYEEVSKKRLICRRFDQMCQHVLNSGFNRIVRRHAISFKRIKALLPRRESERRNHCLARHADILTSIETRISMLSMTYSKYMELHLCCFIPGRVLDEIIRILALVARTQKPLRPHEVLQELRDISSMAIEHFDEKIAITLKRSIAESGSSSRNRTSYGSSSNSSLLTDATASTSSGSGLGNIVVSCGVSNTQCGWNAACTTSLHSGGQCICDAIRRGKTLVNFAPTVLPAGNTTAATPNVGIRDVGVGQEQHQQQPACPQVSEPMVQVKKLEVAFRDHVGKIMRAQSLLLRRFQDACNAINAQNLQIVELKKRLEDLDAKNREITASMKHINPCEPPAAVKPAETLSTSVAPSSVVAAAGKRCHEDDDTANTSVGDTEPQKKPRL